MGDAENEHGNDSQTASAREELAKMYEISSWADRKEFLRAHRGLAAERMFL